MFTNLPEEIERIIWKFYFTQNTVEEIKKINSVWCKPSDKLVSICQEIGSIQHKYTDFERVVNLSKSDYVGEIHRSCLNNLCLNCLYQGFPCMNAWYYGGFDAKLCNVWTMDFYKD